MTLLTAFPEARRLGAVVFALSLAATSGIDAVAAPSDDVELSTLSGTYLAARQADSERDIASAAKFYRAAFEADPDNQFLLDRALVLTAAEGNINKAVEFADQLIERVEAHRVARLVRAVRAVGGKTYSAAINEIERSGDGVLADLTKTLIGAWADFGSGEVDAALESIDALEGEAWYEPFKQVHSGHIALVGGRAEDALASFGRAYERDNGAIRIAEAYARALAISGRKEQAVGVLEDFLRRFPGNPLAERALADVKAEGPVAPMIRTPGEGAAEVLSGLGAAIGQEGGAELSVLYLRLALFLEPQAAGGLAAVSLGRVLVANNQGEDAIVVFESIDADAPFRSLGLLQAATALDRLDRIDEADQAFRDAIAADPDDVTARMTYGTMLRGRERFAEAAVAYTGAVDLIGEPASAHWTLFYFRGIAYERTKEWPKAEADFLKALELKPDEPLVMNYLGYSWVDMGINLDRAMDLIRKAVELRPNDGYIVDSLGWAYYRLGRYEEAVEELERALSLRAEDPIINDHLGDAYWKVGRTLEAQFQWRHARDLGAKEPELELITRKIETGTLIEKELQVDLEKTDAGQEMEAASATDGTSGGVYVVSPGESLWDISAKLLGNGSQYWRIYEANRDILPSPDAIAPGMQLKIPQGL